MDVANLQLKIMTSGGSFYPQKRLSYCVEVTKRDQKLKEEKVITHLLKLYDKMEVSNEEKIQIYLYLLKHEEMPAEEVRKGLRKIGLEKRRVDIEDLGAYEYAIFDLEKGKYNKLSPVERLERAGVTTLEVIPPKELKKYQRDFDATLLAFPEYRRDKDDPTLDSEGNPLVYVAGGFAALGNPASFHNEFSRKLRIMGYQKMKILMNEYASRLAHVEKPYNLQALSDRMMFRQEGQQPSAEAWHRDVMPPDKIEYEDEIFGGWINLDSIDQYFSCIPGSHTTEVQKTLNAGFATLTDAIAKIMHGEPPEDKIKPPDFEEVEPQMTSIIEVFTHEDPYDRNIPDKKETTSLLKSIAKAYRKKGYKIPKDKINKIDQDMMYFFGSGIGISSIPSPEEFYDVYNSWMDNWYKPKTEKKKKPTAAELKPYIAEVTRDRHRFRVPPGHMIVFPQYILHEVVANKAKYNMRRQFTGWRLTPSKKPLYPLELFDQQAVIPLPGGMIPPMYARNHLSYFQEKQFNMTPETKYNLTEWSEATFRKRCLVKTKKGEPIVQRHMDSLAVYRFPLYPPYLKKERSIYIGENV
jgi:hypothetical protein